MTNQEITALAREYAEEIHYGDDYFESENKRLLTWLTRRYCLVERSKIREAYKDAQKDQHNPEGDFALTLAGRNRSAVLIDLFPDLGKEVES